MQNNSMRFLISITQTVFFTFLILLCIPQWFYCEPSTGLDPSWMLAIRDAFVKGKVFGEEMIFTYGPLGYLSTRVIDRTQVVSLIVYDITVVLSFALVFKQLLKNSENLLNYFLIFGLALVVRFSIAAFPTTVLFLLFLFWMLMYHQTGSKVANILSAAMSILLFFIKINYGFVAVIVYFAFIINLFIFKKLSLNAVLIFITLYLTTLLVLSSLLNVNFIGYICNGYQIISGYNDNMWVPHPLNSKVFYSSILLFVMLLTAVSYATNKLKENPQHILPYLLSLLAFFLLWKNSFCRYNGFFVLGVTFCSPILFGVYCQFSQFNRCFYRCFCLSLILPLGILVGGNLVFGRKELISYFPFSYVSYAAHAFKDTPTHPINIKNERALPDSLRKLLGNATVDVMPCDLSLAVVNGLNASFRPIPQSYSAYTPILDHINANFYRSPKSPEFVIFVASGLTAIDGKHGFWDESEVKRVLITRYSLVGEWELTLDFWGTGVYKGKEKVFVLKKRQTDLPIKFISSQNALARINHNVDIDSHLGPRYLFANVKYSFFGIIKSLLHQSPLLNVGVSYDGGGYDEFRVSPSILKTGILISHKSNTIDDMRSLFDRNINNNKKVIAFCIKTETPYYFRKDINYHIDNFEY